MTITFMLSGRTFNAAAPHPSMVRFADIGGQLAKINMHFGATAQFYSAAQHAILVAQEMSKVDGPLGALYGLLHNADMAVECRDELTRAKVKQAIHEALDLDWPAPKATVKALTQVHARVDLSEKQQLMTGRQVETERLIKAGVWPLRFIIKPLTWDRAADKWFDALRGYAIAASIPHMPSLGGVL